MHPSLFLGRKSSTQQMELYQLIVVDGDGYAEPETEPPPTHRREAYAVREDKVQVVFRATVPNWYGKADKGDQLRVSELFEAAYTWAESHFVDKLGTYSKLWYKSAAGEKYYKDWHHAKWVIFSLSIYSKLG